MSHLAKTAILALFGAIAFESRLSWGLILTVGASLSLAALMTRTGAAAWLGQFLLHGLTGLAGTLRVLISSG